MRTVVLVTTSGDSRKAKKLAVGDVVSLKGKGWTVAATARRADQVRLTLESGTDSFTRVVEADRRFELHVVELIDASGAQTRWASPAEQVITDRRMTADVVTHIDGAMPEVEEWVPNTDAERAVASMMGGTLVGVQRLSDGAWMVPAVDSSTVFAHLLTFHATEPPSAHLNDVRTPLAEQTETAAEALMRADVEGALALHAAQHADGLPDAATPHTHGGRA